ncbi:serine integrase [Mycobacterium phage SororFago]|nr:serine integrase [Mycobacterium phage SororFago]
MNTQVRALVGARVSHVQGEEKTSHITQRGKGEAYAESQGWEVVGAFEDLDVSAIKLSPWQRPDLKGWLDERADDWDALIFAKTDRVFRSANDCVKLAEWCKEHRKILVLVDDGIKLDYFNPEQSKDAFAGAMSKVFLILAAVFAEIEGQRFVQRARDRVAYLRPTDRWGYGNPPYGFKIVDHPSGVGKSLAHDDEDQAVLRRIANEVLAGKSIVSVCVKLNDEGVMSPIDRTRVRGKIEPKEAKWRPMTMKRLLTNPSTQGIKMSKGKPVLDEKGDPVIVGPASFDHDTWARLQEEMGEREAKPAKQRHTLNPLLGVAKCAQCGLNMRQHAKKTKYGSYRYYNCIGHPIACPKASIVAETAEEEVYRVFLDTHAHRKVKERVWQVGTDQAAELDRVLRTIDSLREDRAMGLFDGPEDEKIFRQQMAALRAKRDELQATPNVRTGWVEVETEKTYGQVWESATPEEKRKMLIDAGIVIWVTNRNDYYVGDLEKLLGEGDADHPRLASTVLKKSGLRTVKHAVDDGVNYSQDIDRSVI